MLDFRVTPQEYTNLQVKLSSHDAYIGVTILKRYLLKSLTSRFSSHVLYIKLPTVWRGLSVEITTKLATVVQHLPRGSAVRCVGGMRGEEPSCCCDWGTGGANMPDGGSGAETGGCGKGNVGRPSGGRFKDDNRLEVPGARLGMVLQRGWCLWVTCSSRWIISWKSRIDIHWDPITVMHAVIHQCGKILKIS